MIYKDLPRISKWTDVQKLIDDDALTPAEVKVIDAAREGEAAWLGDTVPVLPSDDVLIRAPLLRYLILGGCADFKTEAVGVQVWGAWVAGTLDLDFAKSAGSIGLIKCHIAEQPRMMQLKLPLLNMNDSILPKGLNAQGAQVGGGVFLRGVTAKGEVRLSGATITGQFACEGATFENAEGFSLNAQGAQIGGGVVLEGVTAKGEVCLTGAVITMQLNCRGATLENAGGDTLNAQGAQVGGGVFLEGVTAKGEVSLPGATITGQLDCEGATLENAEGRALNMQDAIVKGGFFWRDVKAISGHVDLNSAHVSGGLVDDAASWEKCDRLSLVALTYDSLHGSTDVTEQLRWLKKGAVWNGEFHPQPYEQLAKVLRETGHRADASAILVKKEIEQRAATRGRWRNERQARRTLWRRSKKDFPPLIRDNETGFARYTTQETVDRFNVLHPVPDHPKRDAVLITDRYDISPYIMQQAQRDFRNQQRWTNLRLRLSIGGHWCADKLLRGIIGYGYRPQRSFYALVCLIGLGWLHIKHGRRVILPQILMSF